MSLSSKLKTMGYRDRIALARAVRYYSTKIARSKIDYDLTPIASHARLARRIETYDTVEQDIADLLVNAARNGVPVCAIAGTAYSYCSSEKLVERINRDNYMEKCLVWYINCVAVPKKLREEAQVVLDKLRD